MKKIQSNPNNIFRRNFISLAVGAAVVCSNAAYAQEEDEKKSAESLNLETIVVTGSVKGTTKLNSTLSVTTVSQERAESFVPQGTVDVLRSIPGIRAESTGGDSNGNITVRGVPLGGGGSRFLQLHEDGLPVLQFGDIIVGNADNYFSYDQTINVVEAIKGGTAATLASNSPSGIVNFVSKTGEVEEGTLIYKTGLDYDQDRLDFAYGTPVGNDWAMHIGGFYRTGEGVRDAGFNAEDGGQIKLSVTRFFDNGKARLYYKHLDDQTATILPMPVLLNNKGIPGLDPREATNIPVGLINNQTTDGSGGIRESSIKDGNSVRSSVIGGELQFDFDDSLTVTEKFRVARNSGQFFGAFSAGVGAAVSPESIGVPNAENLTLGYAHGVDGNQPLSQETLSTLNGNGLIQDIRTFDNDINSLDNFTNDLSLTKSLEMLGGYTNVTVGYYVANQEADIDWFWQSHIADVQNIPRLMNLYNEEGEAVTANGQIAYGSPQWGNCCTRDTYFDSSIDAYYLAIDSEVTDSLSVSASVRRDSGELTGSWLQATVSPVDVDNNGELSFAEMNTETFTQASFAESNKALFGYDWDYTSFALGFNYIIDDGLAVFGNYSDGARASFGDRLADAGFIVQGQAQPGSVVNELRMLEAGIKYQADRFGIFATAFNVNTDDANSESARGLDNPARIREFESNGIEIEATANIGMFNFFGGITYTDAEIKGANNPEVVGNVPRRQPDLVYSGTASYAIDEHVVGLSFFGRTDSYVSDDNTNELDGYLTFNAFANYFIADDLSVRLAVNNLTDELALTEAEGGFQTVNGLDIIRARSILGRSTSLELRYTF
ncbi:TonB-dependent receptor domain-containing protein [Salinimonas chungwhensis]|uniref:TonB-dependent receptor domain-containing protein n=1 Tax=Salinimonas chungwhensis TaxID=265425 RepID=UPI0003A11FC6|nr:TonB-dependent receptor [Salinimonas chungwhensis]